MKKHINKKIYMKLKYSRIVVMGVMGIFSVLLFALALAQSVAATTIGTNVTTVDMTATGNTILGNATTDTLTIQGAATLTTAATDTLNVLTGNLKVGNATPAIAMDGEDAYIEGILQVDGTTYFSFNGTEQLMVASDLAGTVEGMVRIIGTPSTTAGSTMGILVMQNDGSGSNGLDSGITIDNADANLALADAIVITSSGNMATGITTGLDFDDTDIVTDIEFQNSETLDNNTDAQFMFGRNDTGTVTITAKDNNSDAAFTVTPGGAAALTLGTTGVGNTTSITLATDSTGDGEVVLPTDSISTGEILDNTVTATDLSATITFADADLIDYAAILHDDAAAQGLRLSNCGASPTDITGTNEGYVCWDQTGNRLLINDGSSWGAVVGATTTLADNTADALDIQEGTNNYMNVNTANAGAVVQFGNTSTNPSYAFLGSGNITINAGIIGAASVSPDFTSASNEDLQMIAGGTGNIVLTADSDSNVRVVGATATPTEDEFSITNTGLGFTAANIDNLQADLATATGAGANNSALHANLLNAPVDAGDVINGVEVTGVAQTVASTIQNLVFLDPAASGNSLGTLNAIGIDNITTPGVATTEIAISIGSGWDTDIIFVDSSVVISAASGGSITFNDGTASNNLLAMTDAGAITIGSSLVGTTTISLVTDSTGDGEVVLPGSSVSASEIADITRSITLPLGSFVDAANELPLDVSGADSEPDFDILNDGLVIEFDDTSGSVDVNHISTTFVVPQAYASAGSIVMIVAQDAATGTNIEAMNIGTLEQGTSGAPDATVSTFVATNLTNSTNLQSVSFALTTGGVNPTLTLAAGTTVQLRLRQDIASADDIVRIFSVEFQYTATE